MRARYLACLAVLLATTPAWAQEKKEIDSPTPGQEQFRAVRKELTEAQQKLNLQFKEATTPEEKEKIQEELSGLVGKFSDRFFKIAKDFPKDPGAEEALVLLSMQLGINEKTAEQGAEAFALLVANFPTSKKMNQAVNMARYSSTATLEKPLRQIMETHSDAELQSLACLTLAENLRVRHEKAVQKKDSAGAVLYKQAEELLRTGTTKFSETKSAKEFDDGLFALANLTVGKTPPPIEGENVVDAKPLKLSDYKGKVVVVCFWGNWCPPCRAMYPHERSLVKRLEGKPFALLGVNSDKDREKTIEIMAKEQLTWPSFWNDGSTRGAISTTYRVRFWPTIYVLDADGIIRYRNVRGKAMDEAVDTLLKELASK